MRRLIKNFITFYSDVAEKRSRQLERFLRRVASHERLITDCDVRDFLSFEAPLPKAAFTSALSGSSMMKMFKSFGDAFSKLAFPMDENDRWFEQANSQVRFYYNNLNADEFS